MTRYAYPRLGRYGLAHGILAWARAQVFCADHQAVPIAPIWFKPRVGPYLRRERDKREYFRLFKSGDQISGIRRLVILAKAPKILIGTGRAEAVAVPDGTVAIFENALKDNEIACFDQVVGHGPYLRERLIAMTRSRHIPPPRDGAFVAIHVRMGDFLPLSESEPQSPANNVRLPLSWYVDRLVALRGALGPLPATVFSDGSDAELAELLSQPGVTRAPKASAVTDMLAMGLGCALIASGSGFSLWGAFLGSAPRISHPGRKIVPIYSGELAAADIESPAGSAIETSFLEFVRHRLETVQP